MARATSATASALMRQRAFPRSTWLWNLRRHPTTDGRVAPSWWRSAPYCRWTEQAAQRGKAHGGASPQVAVLSLLGGLDVAHPAHGVHDLRAVPVSRAETAL